MLKYKDFLNCSLSVVCFIILIFLLPSGLSHVYWRAMLGAVQGEVWGWGSTMVLAVLAIAVAVQSTHIYWFHDGTGLCIVNDFSAGTLRYFACGCDHDYKELSGEESRAEGVQHWGSCYHVLKCTKCKNIQAHDSSD